MVRLISAGTKTIVGVVEESGQIITQLRFPTDTHHQARPFPPLAPEALRACINEAGTADRLGVTMPGMVDSKSGRLINAAFAGWRNVDVRGQMSRETGIPFVQTTMTSMRAPLRKSRFGHGSRYRDFIWMTVSTGVGGAVVTDGRLLRGAWNCAGEFGHIKVEFEHPALCPCGGYGCLEAHGSGTAISRMTRDAARRNLRLPQG